MHLVLVAEVAHNLFWSIKELPQVRKESKTPTDKTKRVRYRVDTFTFHLGTVREDYSLQRLDGSGGSAGGAGFLRSED